MQRIIKTAFAISCLFALVSTAQAFDGGKSYFPLREGPGTHYATIGKVSSKQVTRIGVCNPSWCYVSTKTLSGWVPTAKVNPDLVRSHNQAAHSHSSHSSTSGGATHSSLKKGTRLQASADMTVSMRIVPKATSREQSKRANLLPFPIPAHRRVQTR